MSEYMPDSMSECLCPFFYKTGRYVRNYVRILWRGSLEESNTWEVSQLVLTCSKRKTQTPCVFKHAFMYTYLNV